jgi:MFS family permease
MIIGVIIQVTAIKGHRATAQFIIGRTITGIGSGINTSTISTYQAECSSDSKPWTSYLYRGRNHRVWDYDRLLD